MKKPRPEIRTGWLLLVMLWLISPAAARAQFLFTTNNGTLTISSYTGSGGDVVIPSSTNGYPIVSIGFWAFHWGNPTRIIIPDSVVSIGDAAFFNCTSLTNVTFGSGVSTIGSGAFWGCTSLEAIEASTGNAVYSTSGGVLFDKIQSRLIQCPGGSVGGYTIPNSVTSVGEGAFNSCSSLTSVSFGNGITNINSDAFLDCSSLTAITADPNNGVYRTLNGVLFNQEQTVLITYPPGLNGSYSVPASVTNIADSAFYECNHLTDITLTTNLLSIGDAAFGYCTGLASITVPDRVRSIGQNAFSDCYSLTGITIGNGITSLRTNTFHDCTSLTNVTFGGYLTSIEDGAFDACQALRSITLPGSVTSVGANAFGGCISLVSAYFLGDAPSGDSSIFSGETGSVYYLPGTSGWSSQFGGWPTALWYRPYPTILGSSHGLGANTNGFGFTISWATNIPVVIETTTNLANPVWLPLTTNTLSSGTNGFTDPDWTNYPNRFYRVRSP